MVADKYCQIIERDSATISVLWKGFHMVCLVLATFGSITCVLDFMYITRAFGNSCVLYANLTFTDAHAYETAGAVPAKLSFHNPLTIWGRDTVCSYSKCTYLFSTVVALILLAFFAIFPKGGYSATRPVYGEAWKLIPWALLTSIIMVTFVGIAFHYVKYGTQAFRDQLYSKLNETGECDARWNCPYKVDVFTLTFNPTELPVATYFAALNVAATLALFSWIVLIVSLVVRMLIGIDFRVIVYDIKPLAKDVDTGSSVSSESFDVDDPRILPTKKLLAIQDRNKAQKPSDATDEYETGM